MLTGWGARPIDGELLERFPQLSLVVHGAGSIKGLLTPEALHRGLRFASAAHINARPVAEFCLGIILCDLKRVWRFHQRFAEADDLVEAWWGPHRQFDGGYYGKRIGLIGWGFIAKELARLLQAFDLEVYVASRHLTNADMREFGVKSATLEGIMETCDVISLHSADIPANHHQINATNLRLMKAGSSLINTARGGIIDEGALVAKLQEGSIWAYLDVAVDEPPARGHPFYELPNCVLTPHVSGSIGTETWRLGAYCLREIDNFLQGRPLENEIDLRQIAERA